MTIQFGPSRDPKEFFTGYSFFKAKLMADRFDVPPEKITPVELIEWALVEGEWYLGNDSSGQAVWYGPLGNRPMPGQNKVLFTDLKEATEEMRIQYSGWWDMRITYDTAMRDLNQKMTDLFLKKMKEKGSGKSEETSEGFEEFLKAIDGLSAEDIFGPDDDSDDPEEEDDEEEDDK